MNDRLHHRIGSLCRGGRCLFAGVKCDIWKLKGGGENRETQMAIVPWPLTCMSSQGFDKCMCVCEWIIKSEFLDQQDYISHWGGSEGHRRSCHLGAFSIYIWWRTSLAFILSDTHTCATSIKWNRKSLLFIKKLPFCLSLGVSGTLQCVFQQWCHIHSLYSSV